jgi:hypothetical protein
MTKLEQILVGILLGIAGCAIVFELALYIFDKNVIII